jgi:heme-degrading monooxygenase HmoA
MVDSTVQGKWVDSDRRVGFLRLSAGMEATRNPLNAKPAEKEVAGAVISKHWKGIAKPGEAENYINHLKTDTFPKLAGIAGFISASILKREIDRGTELLIVTYWDSLKAIERFAGVAADTAVVPESVQAMMIRYDDKVLHYEVIEDYKPQYGK